MSKYHAKAMGAQDTTHGYGETPQAATAEALAQLGDQRLHDITVSVFVCTVAGDIPSHTMSAVQWLELMAKEA